MDLRGKSTQNEVGQFSLFTKHAFIYLYTENSVENLIFLLFVTYVLPWILLVFTCGFAVTNKKLLIKI